MDFKKIYKALLPHVIFVLNSIFYAALGSFAVFIYSSTARKSCAEDLCGLVDYIWAIRAFAVASIVMIIVREIHFFKTKKQPGLFSQIIAVTSLLLMICSCGLFILIAIFVAEFLRNFTGYAQ